MKNKNNEYKTCLDFMYSLRRFGIKLGLDIIRGILKNLGNPQNSYHTIHIAGSNGKGSIASNIASILMSAGYKTGLYTSPHLVRFNERIKINDSYITDKNIVRAYNAVKNANKNADREATFFEFTTGMAFYEFKKQNVDVAIIETGMGGRLDATNIISPALCIITNISMEHKTYLGNKITDIAKEKGGIIKENTPVITGAKQKNVTLCLENISKQKKAPIYKYRKDFKTKRNKDKTFTYFGLKDVFYNMKTSLLGRYQIDNAALTIAACELLKKDFPNINEESIRCGLQKNVWHGRIELVSKSPLIILDGAHNLAACKELAFFLLNDDEIISGKDITLILGILDDKPYEHIMKILLPACKRVIFTKPIIERAIEPEKLLKTAEKLSFKQEAYIIPNVKDALLYAAKISSDDAICAAGSLYVVGEAKAYLDKNNRVEK
jgi:dihydrofolate synthase / folylpolyglutamate synthase